MKMDSLMNTMLQQLAGTVGGARPEQLAQVARLMQEQKQICITGAGRTGLVMRMLAMRLAQMGLSVQVAGDVTCGPVGEGSVLVAGSGSGETEGLVRQAQKAKRAGAKLAVLTTAPESTLAAMADAVAVVPAPTKERAGGSVLPMGSLFDEGLLLACDWLVAHLMEQCGITEAGMKARHANLE